MEKVKVDSEQLRFAEAVADDAVKSGAQKCAAIAVANRTETLWTKHFSGENRVAADTIYLLASITKPILAVAVMRLVEQGILLLNRPVAAYLPEFGANGKQNVTTYHLLTHTSGMDETRWMQWRVGGQEAGGPCFEEACRTHLTFEPGARCSYCTLSFAVMAELITRLTGKRYPDYLREHIFEPLGMRDMSFQPADIGRAAPVHDFGTPEQLNDFMERAVAGGGLWSTASDLVTFGQALLRGGTTNGYHLLSPASITTMTRLQTAGKTHTFEGRELPFNYGLGWGKGSFAEGALGSETSYGHGGATGTLLWIDPGYDLIFVYLTNRWGDDNLTARRALNAVYGALTVENKA